MDSSVTAIILAAGLGTRMKSKMAKVLHRAGGLTLVEHVVRTARSVAAPENTVVVVGHQADQVRTILAQTGVRFVQQDEQRGTGHAVKICRGHVPESGLLVVLYGDAPLISPETVTRLVERQRSSRPAATVLTTLLDDPTGYGRILLDSDGNVEAIVEQKAATPQQKRVREINSGIYCFRADLLWQYIDEIGTANPAGEYYLTDIVALLRRADYKVQPLRLDLPDEILGINTRVELAAVDRIFRDRKVRDLMLAGVTIEKPETVTVDQGVEIGPDTIVEPFARLTGNTVVGEDCRIGSCVILENARLANGVHVGPFTHIVGSNVGEGAQIGPYARLRMHNEVGAGARIGNFVELKNTTLGPGSKANHLSYLGDSTIGEKVNIGAGTITCNYDGVHKHKTAIGDGSFIGSNATLVAPIQVGDGSYIAAGSVITDPVPAEALGIGRGRQVNKEGWAAKRRKGTGA